jgi:hypothetical protein
MTERRTGLLKTPSGTLDPLMAISPDGAQYVVFAHHANVEVTRHAKSFIATTPSAGVAPGTALTTTPPLTLYNPQNSNVYLALIGAKLGYVSGTLGGGSLVLGANPSLTQVAPTGGTPLTSQCTLFGFITGKGLAYQGATLAAAPTLVAPVFTLGAFVGTTAALMELDAAWEGDFMLAPGASVSLQGIAGAGTAPLVLLSLLWEEVSV